MSYYKRGKIKRNELVIRYYDNSGLLKLEVIKNIKTDVAARRILSKRNKDKILAAKFNERYL